LIGFADTGLNRDYQNLDWFVLVSQNAREAFAVTRGIGRMIAFMALIGWFWSHSWRCTSLSTGERLQPTWAK